MLQGKGLLAHLSPQEAESLCAEIRTDLLSFVSATGGHLSSNLGTVELTVALHRVYDTAVDRLVFDVGHQCYAHKWLTGRKKDFATLRQYKGMSGYPKPSESIHDAFVAGHASNSIAVATGMAKARGAQDYHVIALLGDGALTGGLAYEGLCAAGQIQGQCLVILNDNGMSITKNVGGLSTYLAKQRLKPQYLRFRQSYRKVMEKTKLGRKIHHSNHQIKQAIKQSLLPCSFFEQLGLAYYGPVDAHDLETLTKTLGYLKELDCPVVLHVRSTKGKGYGPAQEKPDAFHGVSPFSLETGELAPSGENFSKVFGDTMISLAKQEEKLCAITAAMSTGTGLSEFAKEFPHRLYDVGIAEGAAVSMAGGLAKQGALPVFAVYSTFLQRAYDMILHDVALLQLPVVFAIDRCGLVGEDGETHHGVFDLSFLSTVPGMRVFAPSSYLELSAMLKTAIKKPQGMVAIRYPRGTQGAYQGDFSGKNVDVLSQGTDITLVSYGKYINHVQACEKRLTALGFSVAVLKINRIYPLDTTEVLESIQKTGCVLVAEDVVATASLGEQVAKALAMSGTLAHLALINVGDRFIGHGTVAQLEQELALDVESLVEKSLEVMSRGKGTKTTTGCSTGV